MNKNKLFLPNESLTLMAARPRMEHEALALTIAQKLQQKCPERQVVYFSLEATRQQIYCHGNIPFNSDVCVIDNIFYLEDMHRTIRLLQKYEHLRLIVIDHLELVDCLDSEYGRSRWDSSDDYSQKQMLLKNYVLTSLKNIAKDLNIPILVLTYLPRNVDCREDKHPLITYLKTSKINDNNLNQIWFLYRDLENLKSPKHSELIIAKNSYGVTETIELSYQNAGLCSWFSDFTVSYDIITEKDKN